MNLTNCQNRCARNLNYDMSKKMKIKHKIITNYHFAEMERLLDEVVADGWEVHSFNMAKSGEYGVMTYCALVTKKVYEQQE